MKNTTDNYGAIAKWLHWCTALLFLGSYSTIYCIRWFTEKRSPESWELIQLHFSIGITVLIIAILRIIWRLNNQQPHLAGTQLERFLARTMHYTLYIIMIGAPLTGYLSTGTSFDYFYMFEITQFSDTQLFTYFIQDGLDMTFKTFEKPLDFIHKNILGEWLIWLLILGHASAALYHHFLKKDRTLYKMTYEKKN